MKQWGEEAAAERYQQCRHCPLRFPLNEREQYQSHVTSHLASTGVEYSCASCSKTFSQPDELQKHLLDLHATHLYRCSLCHQLFDTKVSIQVLLLLLLI